MAKQLFEFTGNNSIVKVMISADWRSTVPWEHNGVNVPYWFGHYTETEDNVRLTCTYFGPFAVLRGKWIKNNA